MIRLRRKYVLYLSGLLLAVFLFFYALINYSISPQKTQVGVLTILIPSSIRKTLIGYEKFRT